MNREVYLRNITDSLALLSQQISLRNAINLYDINIVAESFYADLLNLIWDYNLINLNTVKKNAPGIDLVDGSKRISIQVTSDNSSSKIKHTIKEFLENKSYEQYDRLIVLILTSKKNYTATFDTQKKFSFDHKRDILDVSDLVAAVQPFPLERLKKINDFLQLEFNEKLDKKSP